MIKDFWYTMLYSHSIPISDCSTCKCVALRSLSVSLFWNYVHRKTFYVVNGYLLRLYAEPHGAQSAYLYIIGQFNERPNMWNML